MTRPFPSQAGFSAHRPNRPTVLLADDDTSFIASLEDALSNEPYELLLAHDGAEAKRLLEEHEVDLVVTDIRMPRLDGVAFIAELSKRDRALPCIVMTAFGTPELELKLEQMGIIELIDKPIDVGDLRERIRHGLGQSAKDSVLRGLSVASFLQLLALEQKTCTVRVNRAGDAGMLFFLQGELIDAWLGDRIGLDAALELVTWDQAQITVRNLCRIRHKSIDLNLDGLLLEAMRRKDEQNRPLSGASEQPRVESGSRPRDTERKAIMALEAYLQEFREIKGYIASGIMDFTGETLVTDSVSNDVNLEATGAVFNDIFRSAHEASKKIGLEACKKMMIATPKGLIVMECSGVDSPSHLHFIVILEQDGNQALARKMIEKVLPKVVADMS